MCQSFLAHYPSARSSTPGEVRAFVERSVSTEVSGDGLEPVLDSVRLIATELATNAVRAGTGPLDVDLEVRRTEVELRVSDNAPGWPAVQHPTPETPHGRGLLIVDALSSAWGTERHDDGKQVWATLELPAELVHASPCQTA